MCWEAKRSLYQNTMRTAFLISAVGFAEEMKKKAFPNDNFMYSLFSDYIISAYDYCNKKISDYRDRSPYLQQQQAEIQDVSDRSQVG